MKTLFKAMAAILLCSLIFLSCSNTMSTEDILSEEPETALSEEPEAETGPSVEGSNPGSSSNQIFYFLPPLVPEPEYSGEPDPDLNPVVEIFEASSGALLASFTTASDTVVEQVRFDPEDGHYIVNFNTNNYPIIPNQLYKIIVLTESIERGGIEILAVEVPADPSLISVEEVQDLFVGRTFPIKFRIEKENS